MRHTYTHIERKNKQTNKQKQQRTSDQKNEYTLRILFAILHISDGAQFERRSERERENEQ